MSNYCKFNSQLLTLFTSSLYVTDSFFASSVTRTFGPRPSMLYVAGAALCGAASSLYMLIPGRLLLGIGIGIGFANQSVPLYLSEMAPPRYRGAMNNGFQFTLNMAALSSNLINFGTAKLDNDLSYRISLSMASIPAVVLALGAIFLPETPKNKYQEK